MFTHLNDKLVFHQFEEALIVLALIKNANPYTPIKYRIADMFTKVVGMMQHAF